MSSLSVRLNYVDYIYIYIYIYIYTLDNKINKAFIAIDIYIYSY